MLAVLIDEYEIETAEDIQNSLKDILGGNIKRKMEDEIDAHLGYKNYERRENSNSRNSLKTKAVRSNMVNSLLTTLKNTKAPSNQQSLKVSKGYFRNR